MKKYDIVAIIGEYTDKNRTVKSVYRNVGELHEKDGKPFLIMDKSFNLSAVKQRNPNDAKVLLSCFEPKAKETNGPTAEEYTAAKNGQPDAGAPIDWDKGDDIPF